MAQQSLEDLQWRQQRRKSPEPQKASLQGQAVKPEPATSDQGQGLVDDHEDLKTLKAFDLDYTYGPTIGLTRLERWERAKGFGLQPPERVRELLEESPSDPAYTQCLWDDTLAGNHFIKSH